MGWMAHNAVQSSAICVVLPTAAKRKTEAEKNANISSCTYAVVWYVTIRWYGTTIPYGNIVLVYGMVPPSHMVT